MRFAATLAEHWPRGGWDAAPIWLRLAALPRRSRADFALACAERALALVERGPRVAEARQILVRRGAISPPALESLAAEILSPDDPAYDRPYHEALTLTVYAARAAATGQSRFARWCAKRAVEAAADPKAEAAAQAADLRRLANRP